MIHILNLIHSGKVVSELMVIAQKVVVWLTNPSQEDVYDTMSSQELTEMFTRREKHLRGRGKEYGGIRETINSLKNIDGKIKSYCMLAEGFHFHFMVGESDDEIVGIVYVQQ